VEFGVIHDADDRFARAIVAAAQARTGLVAALNAPYSAADDVTHTLRLQATPYGLPNAMLEIRNDLIATPAAEDAMAELLAPVLSAALAAASATQTALAG
jgi:predicted N-formylglutamate amidohydrolase